MTLKLNPNIKSLASYVLADLSVPPGKPLISLAQNELCFSPTEKVKQAASKSMANAQLYPDPDWLELSASIAEIHALNNKQILCGAGSMELLEVLGRIYLSNNDRVLMSEYGYSFFKTVAQMYGAAVDTAKEVNFTANVDHFLELVTDNTKIVFIANPGNPTGTLISSSEIRRLREKLPDHILLIIDEAYAEFIDNESYCELFDLVDLGNSIILRTFSKIYGLAGMRVGWGYFPENIYAAMRKVLNPNNISAPSQTASAIAMQQQDVIKKRKITIKAIREKFSTELISIGLTVPPSHSNFVLINFNNEHNAQTCFNRLREQGILMRPMGAYNLSHCLRATISQQEHMDMTIKHLTQILKENPA